MAWARFSTCNLPSTLPTCVFTVSSLMHKASAISRFDSPSASLLRTSRSHEEGCERDWSVLTKQFTGKNGRVTEGRFVRVEWQTD